MFNIREMVENDWEFVKEIYEQALIEGKSTFTKEVPTYENWDKSHLKDCRYIIEKDKKIIGWCSLSPTSSREVYKGVVEVSIYIHQKYRNIGAGKFLLNYLVKESEKKGYWSLISSIISSNINSIKLHEKCGFRQVGHREKIAKDIFGIWQNTVLYEKRSKIIF
ncbi:GNAT family N-acetyltransferase [Fusobacterium perfoetens]|uniref:GNAT family N-acetyltransferase n=1 Tax=Fusobacterium perfoetens TaxID=852 RepID=UPI00055D41D4|nr:GNAT family N-acetyltransferase [Fusobacterium perfoetens]